MYFRNKKRFVKHFFLNQIFLTILGLLIIIAISIPLAEKVSKKYKINKEIKELEKEIADMENKNLEFKNLFSYLESEQFIEEQARLNLNYKKEGEEMAVIKDESGQFNGLDIEAVRENIPLHNIQGESQNNREKRVSNIFKWRRYFFK